MRDQESIEDLCDIDLTDPDVAYATGLGDRHAKEVLQAIKAGKVRGIYHISQIPGTREVLARYDEMKAGLIKARKFIDNIMPSCAAGHDELNGLKNEIDGILNGTSNSVQGKQS